MDPTTDVAATFHPGAGAAPPRRWRTVEQVAQTYPFTEAAIRMLIQRSRPHYNHRGELIDGNGLAGAICQPGGRHGKVLIDEITFGLWLERWTVSAAA